MDTSREARLSWNVCIARVLVGHHSTFLIGDGVGDREEENAGAATTVWKWAAQQLKLVFLPVVLTHVVFAGTLQCILIT